MYIGSLHFGPSLYVGSSLTPVKESGFVLPVRLHGDKAMICAFLKSIDV